MKHFKSVLAMLLALVMVLSCVGVAFASEKTVSTGISGKADLVNTSKDKAEAKEEALKGFKSESFKELNSYQYADDEIVRAIVILEGDCEADVAAVGTQKAAAQRVKLVNEHNAVFAAMKGIDYELKFDFTRLLNGFSCDVAYGDLEAIAAIDGVSAVHIANSYAEPEYEKASDTKMGYANLMMDNYYMQESGYDGAGIVIAVLDTGLALDHEAFADFLGTAAEYGKLSKEDVEAADTLADGIYVSGKVPFAYDYADGDTDVTDNNGHGTHVSGISAGFAGYETPESEDSYVVTFTGAAPAAQILSMKIFKDEGGGTTSDIYFYALEDAYTLGADVVNMSIGAQNGFTYDDSLETELFGDIYNRLSDAGVILSVAAGNEYSMAYYSTSYAGYAGYVGPDYQDYGTVASPSTYTGNVSVASVENYAYPSLAISVDGTSVGYNDSCTDGEHGWLDTFAGKTLDYVAVFNADGSLGYGYESDYASIDVKGKIAVVSRGDITFEEKVEFAANAGAIGCIVVNNDTGTISMAIDTFEIPAISLQISALNALNASGTIETFTELTDIENPDGYLMSDFSNWGTSPMLTLDPAITGVGGMVYSSVPGGTDTYEVYSGTSMATPNMTGTYANVLTAIYANDPTISKADAAELAKTLLYGSTYLLTDEDDYLYSPRKQGAGLASAYYAVDNYLNSGYITNPLQELGDDPTKTGVYEMALEVKNDSEYTLNYTELETYVLFDYLYTDEYGDVVNTLTSDYAYATGNETNYATVTYEVGGAEVTEFSVPAGSSVTVKVTIKLHDEIKEYFDGAFPNGNYVEGYVVFNEYFEVEEGNDPNPFTDISESDWYYEYVLATVGIGLVNGYSDGSFRPDNTLTRAEAVTLLYRLSGSPEVEGSASFTDIPDAWYQDAIAWGVEAGVVKGITETTFAPSEPVTREQFVTMLWRLNGEPEAIDELTGFEDVASVSAYAKTAFAWAVENGIVNGTTFSGKSGTYLVPQNYIKRCEVAKILYVCCDFSSDSSALYWGGATSATFLAFYGDWTEGAVLEAADFMDIVEADNWLNTTVVDDEGNTYGDYGYTWANSGVLDFYTMPKTAYITNGEMNKAYAYAGNNMLDYVDYYAEHIGFSTPLSDGSYHYAEAIYMEPYQLRNATHLIMTVSNKETGEVYYEDDTEYACKAYYDDDYGWQSYGVFYWDGTDKKGNYVPSGTVVNINYDAVLPYGNAPQDGCWSFDATVDYTAPVIESIVYDEEAQTLTVTASDENYLQAIYLADSTYNILDFEAFSSDKKGESFTATFDVSYMDACYVTALDYATNEIEKWTPLCETGLDAVVTFYDPTGVATIECATGDSLTFAAAPEVDGYEFMFWVTEQVEYADMESIWYLSDPWYYEGDEMLVAETEYTFYALYAKVELTELETPNYYLTTAYDYTGDWAIGGWNLDESYSFIVDDPYALNENGTATRIAEIDGATIGDYYIEFYAKDDGIRFTFDQVEVGIYTVQNAKTGKYLATNDALEIVYVDEVDDNAKWDVSAADNGNSTLMYNVGVENAILLYNDEEHCFSVFDDTVPYYEDYTPSEWFWLPLYCCETTQSDILYFTTEVK